MHGYGQFQPHAWINYYYYYYKREILTGRRKILTGKREKQYTTQVICDSIYKLGEYYVSRE